jgi:ribosomal protein S18 acetylase RimI-like enzyme
MIRAINEKDAERILKLEKSCFKESFSDAYIDIFCKKGCGFVYIDDIKKDSTSDEKTENILGYITIVNGTLEDIEIKNDDGTSKIVAIIYSLGVDPDHRKKGIGKQLVEKVLDKVLDKVSTPIYVRALVTNDLANKLYMKLGFEKVVETSYAPPRDNFILYVHKG